MNISISVGDIVAVLAFLLSGYAIWTTSSFNKRQLSLIDTQEKLNKRLLEQGESETLQARKADVGASVVKLGNRSYRVRVFNKGKSAARNVQIEFPNGNNMIPVTELRHKFPMEVLEQHQSVDLIAAIHNQTPPKQEVVLKWDDDHANENQKTVYLTF